MKKTSIGIIAIGALVVAALLLLVRDKLLPGTPGTPVPTPVQLQNVSLRLPWIRSYGETGGEVAVALGYFKELGLNVSINAGSVENSPIRKVLTGEDTFGKAEPAQVITAIAQQQAPLVILALAAQRAPMCMMSRASAGIKTVQDFQGKRVGYNPLFDFGYLAMLKKANVDRSKINEVRAAFSLDPFFQGQADVWPVYISNEPIVARSKGIEVSLLCADDAGVKMYEHAIFARKDFVEKNPAVVEAFLKGWSRGWITTFKDTDKAVDIMAARVPELNAAQEKTNLAAFVPLLTADRAKTDGFGWVDAEMIGGVAQTLKDLGLIERVPDPASMVNNSFLLKFDRKIQ